MHLEMMEVSHTPKAKPILNTLTWWLLFLVATVLMSWWFQWFRTFTIVPDLYNGLMLLAVTILLITIFLTMSFDSYVKEKNKDNVKKTIGLFEALYARRLQEGLHKEDHCEENTALAEHHSKEESR
jgi:glucan phosphoethanolaminetransferase (alkaline phosphatase superfamily)